MPQVRFAPAALRDLQRLRDSLGTKDPGGRRRAGETLSAAVRTLRQQPNVGQTLEDLPHVYREWTIGLGDVGAIPCVVMYRYAGDGDVVTVLACATRLA